MLPEEAAYIAGFLDGEGYVSIIRANQYIRHTSYRAVVGFTNTDVSVLQWIQPFLGGTINPKARKSLKHSPAFELKTTCHPAIAAFLVQIQPFLKIKSKQVETVLAFLALGKVKKTMVARGKTWPLFRAAPEDIAARETLRQSLNHLNRRGPLCPQ